MNALFSLDLETEVDTQDYWDRLVAYAEAMRTAVSVDHVSDFLEFIGDATEKFDRVRLYDLYHDIAYEIQTEMDTILSQHTEAGQSRLYPRINKQVLTKFLTGPRMQALIDKLKEQALAAIPTPMITVPQSQVEDHDAITMEPFAENDKIIRIGERNNWIYKRDALLETWKRQGHKSNPLEGARKLAEGTQIEYGKLHIVPDGGRRRRRTRSAKRRTTRRR